MDFEPKKSYSAVKLRFGYKNQFYIFFLIAGGQKVASHSHEWDIHTLYLFYPKAMSNVWAKKIYMADFEFVFFTKHDTKM